MEQRINNMEAKLRKNEYNKLIDDQMKNYVQYKITGRKKGKKS